MDLPIDPYEAAALTAASLADRLGRHDTALVLGSGWSDVVAGLGSATSTLEVASLPGAVGPSVAGHRGTISSIDLGDGAAPVLVLAGRIHLYEGHDAGQVVHLVRAAALAGCTRIVLTNAAGSLRTDLPVGSPVLIADHLNLTGTNPLCGPEPTLGAGTRFVDLTDLYSAAWRASVTEQLPGTAQGVYAGLLGGSFETPAEIRMLAALGADLVGMSTVLEAIAAHQLGAEVLGISLVTNLAAGLQERVDHDEVLATGRESLGTLGEVLRAALRRP